jgi:hypothetical protein
MLGALVFGLVASSALVIGAVAGAYWTPPRLLLASALAFACRHARFAGLSAYCRSGLARPRSRSRPETTSQPRGRRPKRADKAPKAPCRLALFQAFERFGGGAAEVAVGVYLEDFLQVAAGAGFFAQGGEG